MRYPQHRPVDPGRLAVQMLTRCRDDQRTGVRRNEEEHDHQHKAK